MSAENIYRALRALVTGEKRAKAEAAGTVIVDRHRQLGDFSNSNVELDVSFNKEAEARRIIFDPATPSGIFFEVGGRDGALDYLLGVRKNLEFDKEIYQANREIFDRKFRYVGNDLAPPSGSETLIQGDVCSPAFVEKSGFPGGFAAVVYSNNVFEHLRRPWIAAANIYRMLQPGGVCVTIAPFSVRYHEVPGDYFRYTHTGLETLFADAGPIETMAAGYDILGRRNNWQGQGQARDIVPLDEFGAWRENWFTFHAFRKPAGGK